MSDRDHLVILGGNDAGLSTALSLRRCGDERPVTILEKKDYIGVGHCDLPYAAGSGPLDRSELIHQDPEEFGAKYNLEFKMNSRVESVKTARKTVYYRDKNGDRQEIEYGNLLVSTGARPVVPSAFSAADELFTITEIEPVERLNRQLTKSAPVVLIGGGAIGVETAFTLSRRGYNVALIEARRVLLPYSSTMAKKVEELLTEAGVRVFTGEPVEDVKQAGNNYRVITSERQHNAHTVVAALGVTPVTDYLSDPSFNKNEQGGLPVDNRMRTGVQGIYAAGDVILRPQFDGERELWPVASAASLDGWTAGMNLAGHSQSRGQGVRRLGFALAEQSFTRMGKAPDALPDSAEWVEATTGVRYLGEWRKVYTRLAIDPANNQLLAGEMSADANLAGFQLAPLARYLQDHATVDELARLETTYHPELNAMNHPLAIPARKYLQ